jgi:ribosome-binding protein aMBF1 (putative translation factor)
MPWTVETLNTLVDGEIAALPADMRARLVRLTDLIEQIGFEALPRGSVKHLQDRLWELRVTGRDGISRAIYVTAADGDLARLHQEDAEDADARTQARSPEGQGGEMTKIKDLHKKWMKDPEYRREYDALEEEFALAAAVAKARTRAGLSQAELARRMKTTQSTIARLESGRGRPSTRTLDRFAKATGHRLKISFEPMRRER